MGFFDEITEAAPAAGREPERTRDRPERPAWVGPPDWVLPGTVVLDRMLLVSDHVAVAARSASCYPTGLRLAIEVAARQGDWSDEQWEDAEETFWREGPTARRGRRGLGPGVGLMFGVELSDGRRASSAPGFHRAFRDEPAKPYLTDIGGGAHGGEGEFTRQVRLWLWPLPPPGPLDLVLAWPALAVPETHHPLDTDTLLDAAARSTAYWDQP